MIKMIQSFVRPVYVFFGLLIPPFFNFGQDNGLEFLLIPVFVLALSYWIDWYLKGKNDTSII